MVQGTTPGATKPIARLVTCVMATPLLGATPAAAATAAATALSTAAEIAVVAEPPESATPTTATEAGCGVVEVVGTGDAEAPAPGDKVPETVGVDAAVPVRVPEMVPLAVDVTDGTAAGDKLAVTGGVAVLEEVLAADGVTMPVREAVGVTFAGSEGVAVLVAGGV